MNDFHIDVQHPTINVAVLEFSRGRANFFSIELLDAMASTITRLASEGVRAVALTGAGEHFCAGADLTMAAGTSSQPRHLYDAAASLFDTPVPIIAAVQGAAIGGGLGLALAADFRVASSDARFAAPFSRLGLHHGFGLTVTLPMIVGQQNTLDLLYTGRRVKAAEALRLGLCDDVVNRDELRAVAVARARHIAEAAPLAVDAIRRTMRADLAQRVRAATIHERAEQQRLASTSDFAEGVRADAERRTPRFTGR